MSEATVPQCTHEVLSREAGTKAPQRASFLSPSSIKLALCSGAKGLSLSADMQLQRPWAFPKLLAAKLELKHYSVLIPSAVIKGAGHRPMRNPTEPLRSIV